jgi:hypothetical protein
MGMAADTFRQLNKLLEDINAELGSDRPSNWTRDGIINKIKELKEKAGVK